MSLLVWLRYPFVLLLVAAVAALVYAAVMTARCVTLPSCPPSSLRVADRHAHRAACAPHNEDRVYAIPIAAASR